MSRVLYATAGDDGRTFSPTLRKDGAPVDLTGEVIVCKLRNSISGAVITIGGLTGTAGGVVSTEIPSTVPAGRYTMEWAVVDGVTYPDAEGARPTLDVRPEVIAS
jgi:hypothetical protein